MTSGHKGKPAKIKPIAPSLREKKRYLAAELLSEKPFNDLGLAEKAIMLSHKNLFGTVGAAKAGILFLKDRTKTKMLIRINAKHVDDLRASLAFIRNIEKQEVIIRSVGVSGTLKKARENYMRG